MSSRGFERLSSGGEDFPLADIPPRKPLAFSNRIFDNTTQDTTSYSASWFSQKPHTTYVSTDPDESTENLTGSKSDYRRSSRRTSRLSFLTSNPVSNLRIPKFAAPWQHDQEDPKFQSGPATVRAFYRKKQWRRIFINGLFQWFVTFFIVLGQLGLLYGFSQADWLSKWQKYSFNALSTLLSVCLGLAVVTALRAYAKLLSWRFLASGYHDLQDFELIMNCDSQAKVVKLFWAGRKHGSFGLNKTQLLCLASLFLVVGLQITIAMLGLTYSIDSAPTWWDYRYGNVSLVDLSNIYQDSTYNATSLADQTGAANYYGLIGQPYGVYQYPEGQGIVGQEAIYTADNGATFFYNFVDMAVPDATSATTAVVSSKRYVTTNATCVELEIISGGYVNQSGAWADLYYKDITGKRSYIDVFGQAGLTSTYMTNTSNSTSCGSRCVQLFIVDTGLIATDEDKADGSSDVLPHLYACNSTMSQVHRTDLCDVEQNCTLVDKYARYLAGSSGLSGTWHPNTDLQFRTYPPGSPMSWDGDDGYENTTWRSGLVAAFAADAIAAMDDSGPRFTASGWYPVPTVALNVEWQYAIPVLCVVPAIQFVVLLLVCAYANGALIKDGGYLAAARLLRPVVDKIGDHGCALTSDELAREMGNFKIVYGVKAPAGTRDAMAYTPTVSKDADWHVGIIAETEGYGKAAEEGWSVNATFPEGRYDGDCRARCTSCRSSHSIPIMDDEQVDEKARLLDEVV